jgi:hypothetical protein
MGATGKSLALFVGIFLLTASFCEADSQPPAVGGVLPEFTLSVPQNDMQRQYLGVAGKDRFTIPEIRADIVIIEIFSMY